MVLTGTCQIMRSFCFDLDCCYTRMRGEENGLCLFLPVGLKEANSLVDPHLERLQGVSFLKWPVGSHHTLSNQ